MRKNNNNNKKAQTLCIVFGVGCSTFMFILHSICSKYDMNPLSFFFCMSPAFIGFITSMGV